MNGNCEQGLAGWSTAREWTCVGGYGLYPGPQASDSGATQKIDISPFLEFISMQNNTLHLIFLIFFIYLFIYFFRSWKCTTYVSSECANFWKR